VDNLLPEESRIVAELALSLLMKLVGIGVITPTFLIPGVLLAAFGGWVGNVYIASQLSVKRELSNLRAPVLGHFGAAIAGLSTYTPFKVVVQLSGVFIASLRAYGAQDAFRLESFNRLNRLTRAHRTYYNLNRYLFCLFVLQQRAKIMTDG
jgi:hypothetical protein